jgi:signal transduction histidine kinase
VRSRRDRTDSNAVPGAGYRPPGLAAGTQSAASTELAVAAHPGWAARPSTPGGTGGGPGFGAGPGMTGLGRPAGHGGPAGHGRAAGHGGPAGRGEPGPDGAGPGGAGAGPGGGGPGGGPLAIGGAPRSAFRSPLKNWRVRSRLLLLVLLPTLAAVLLGGFSVFSSARSALAFQRVEQFSRLGNGITSLVQALQAEREDTIRYITMGAQGGGRGAAHGAAAPELAVLAQDHRATNVLATRVRSLAGGIGPAFPALAQQEARGAITAVNGLPALRSVVATSQIPSLTVIQEYASTINQLIALEDEIAAGSNDAALADTVRVVGLISATKEEVSQEQAILTSALTEDLVGAAQLGPGQLTAINAAQAEQAADLAQFSLIATPAQRQLYNSALSSAQADHAQAQVQQAITLALDGGSSTENPAFTNAANGSTYLVVSLHRVEQTLMSSIIGQVAGLRDRAITSALLEGLGVLLVLVLALIFTAAVGRSMTRPLARLRTGALEVAGVRLPETVRRMSESGGADLPPDIEPIDVDSTDEIGEVARAFDQVHQEAVRLAANEAALRGNVNAMFVNLSRRSQSLVERQIRLIDDLEQGEQDPERLSNLFQMDHLATRMRRNSENLLVLAGHDLSRRWTEPVALVDVLRAAVSEIEHYERVIPNIQPGISVRGQAVSDVVHLLSELAENATAFSAAETPVKVSGYLLSSGGALVDITDQGVGMDAEEMAHANWRLDNPPVVDVAVSRRMGLFVVSRLAARHGIRVRLRPGPAGGLTALVWLPDEVITRDKDTALGLRPYQSPAAASTARWMENGLDVRDPGDPGEPGDLTRRVPTASGLPPMRPLHFEPGPENGDGATAPTVPGASADPKAVLSAPAADILDALDFADGTDAAAAGPNGGQAAGPNGGRAAGPGAADGHPPAAGEAGSPGAASPAHTVIVPPAPDGAADNRLPIYESVESDWFRRGRSAATSAPSRAVAGAGPGQPATPSHPATPGNGNGNGARAATPEPVSWTSPADAGWQAAEVAFAPVTAGTTVAGLPKRVPKANLVPGAAGPSPLSHTLPPVRTAAQTRDRFASYQQGVRKARTTGPEDDGPAPNREENP